jgi:glycosyltransferase involved in cell wall biosynthesis
MAERPLRILQILRAPVGGLFRHVNDLTQALAARGHEIGLVVDSISSDALTAERLDNLRAFARLGIHSLPMPRVIGGGDFTTPGKIRRLAARLEIEVLHGHGAKGGLGARLARIGTHRVALYTPHGGVLNFRPGSTSSLLFRAIERLLMPITDAIAFESAYAQRAYVEQIGKPRCPSPVIHNGLTPAEFVRINPGADAADFIFIGEFRPVKGIGFLLEALAGVHAPGGRPATLVMAGDGPDRERIEAQIRHLKLSDRVRLLGSYPARPALAMGRCAVVPSLAESLPYVVLEAASAGLQVIATNVGGINEIFGPTEASLVPSSDSAALARAMQAVLDEPAAAQAEMEQRLAFVAEHFSVARMTDGVEALYQQALAHRR